MKFLIIGLLVLLLFGAGGYFFYNQQKLKRITDFESCAKVYPVMTSYPAQCNTPDGRHFVQELSEDQKKSVISPTPLPTVFSMKINTPSPIPTTTHQPLTFKECVDLNKRTSANLYSSGKINITFKEDVSEDLMLEVLKEKGLETISIAKSIKYVVVKVPNGKEVEVMCYAKTWKEVEHSDLNRISIPY